MNNHSIVRRTRSPLRRAAADKWIKRDSEFTGSGHSVYDYHVSGHYMDGFMEGAAWQRRQAKAKKRK